MPRNDWNTTSAHSRKPHHKAMHSAAGGKGHDKKLRAAKNHQGLPGYGRKPAPHRRDRSGRDAADD